MYQIPKCPICQLALFPDEHGFLTCPDEHCPKSTNYRGSLRHNSLPAPYPQAAASNTITSSCPGCSRYLVCRGPNMAYCQTPGCVFNVTDESIAPPRATTKNPWGAANQRGSIADLLAECNAVLEADPHQFTPISSADAAAQAISFSRSPTPPTGIFSAQERQQRSQSPRAAARAPSPLDFLSQCFDCGSDDILVHGGAMICNNKLCPSRARPTSPAASRRTPPISECPLCLSDQIVFERGAHGERHVVCRSCNTYLHG